MNKRFLTLLTSVAAVISLSSCSKADAKGTYKEINFKGPGYLENDYFALKHLHINIAVGESKKLDIDSFPGSYALNSLEFEASDPSIISVNEDGVIEGKSVGVSDVNVKAKDGSFETKARVSVSIPSEKEDCQDDIDSILDGYNDPSYKSPRKVIRYEYSEELYKCEGVIDHGMAGYEAMAFNADTGYFFVEGPSVYYKTPYGAPEVMDGKWIWYPINQGIYTRMIHITPTGKTFYDFNTAKYNSYEKISRDIMNFFFVSGEEILDNLLDNYDGKEDFESDVDYSDVEFGKIDSSTISMRLTESRENRVVSAEEEISYFDIPADTVYSYDYHQTSLFKDNRCRGVDIDMTFYYELNGQNWTREFNRSQVYDDDFEEFRPQNPKDNGYQEVYSIYDL